MRKRLYRKRKKVVLSKLFKRSALLIKNEIAALSFISIVFVYAFLIYYLSLSLTNTYNNISKTVFAAEIYSASQASQSAEQQKLLLHQLAPLLTNEGNVGTLSNKSSDHTVSSKVKGSDHVIEHGSRDKKEVALTFDADMTPVMLDYLHSGQVKNYNDTRITDYLIQSNVKATLFLTGMWIETYPDATRSLGENPLFELANHSYSHPSFSGYCYNQPQVDPSRYTFEIEKTQQLIQEVGHQQSKYFRFPGGCYNQEDLELVKREGLETVHWDSVADDGFNVHTQQIIDAVLRETQNGSIIVMHMGGETNAPQTAEALKTIIPKLQERGYTFVTVSELLRTNVSIQPTIPIENTFPSIYTR